MGGQHILDSLFRVDLSTSETSRGHLGRLSFKSIIYGISKKEVSFVAPVWVVRWSWSIRRCPKAAGRIIPKSGPYIILRGLSFSRCGNDSVWNSSVCHASWLSATGLSESSFLVDHSMDVKGWQRHICSLWRYPFILFPNVESGWGLSVQPFVWWYPEARLEPRWPLTWWTYWLWLSRSPLSRNCFHLWTNQYLPQVKGGVQEVLASGMGDHSYIGTQPSYC